ncbi:ribokinase [Streptomyces sp. NPDC059720]|uniref:ribokinase n=1 Tax=Streptomyces sp. NPDC059720 TaxID=3346924 RepID=UPI0036952898
MSARLIVMGSLNMDLSVTVPRLPQPGETMPGADVVRAPGGKGANQAIAAARLGADVKMIGLLGADAFGDELRARLVAEGVDDRGVSTVAGVASGLALIVVQDDGENTITLSPGANRHVDARCLARLTAPGAIRSGDTVLLQLEVPVDTVLAAARAAREAGALTVLNAAPLPTAPLPAELLRTVDVLVVNETEAAGLLPPAQKTAPTHDIIGDLPAGDQWLTHAERLRSLGPGTVVITLGASGAVAAGQTQQVRVPAFDVEAVDTVGAGDAFSAQLALDLGRREPLPRALRRACAAGALATTRRGAQDALPTRAEVAHLLEAVHAG